jgi:hypothetical protein
MGLSVSFEDIFESEAFILWDVNMPDIFLLQIYKKMSRTK